MACYLWDASALVVYLQKNPGSEFSWAKQRLAKLLLLKTGRKDPAMFIPNFCLAECSKALANIFLQPRWSEKGEAEYRRHVETMLDLVSSARKGLIRTYVLNRSHLVGIEDVFTADHKLDSRDGKRISGLDGLLVSMSRVLAETHGSVCLLTNDKRLAQVCEANPAWNTQAVYIKEQEIPGT